MVAIYLRFTDAREGWFEGFRSHLWPEVGPGHALALPQPRQIPLHRLQVPRQLRDARLRMQLPPDILRLLKVGPLPTHHLSNSPMRVSTLVSHSFNSGRRVCSYNKRYMSRVLR